MNSSRQPNCDLSVVPSIVDVLSLLSMTRRTMNSFNSPFIEWGLMQQTYFDRLRISTAETPRECTRLAKSIPLTLLTVTFVSSALLWQIPTTIHGEEDTAKSEQAKAVSKKRLEIMQSAIDAFVVNSKEIESEKALALGKKPQLRYDDQVRNLLDAGVWRIGEGGRPTAFITIELYGAGEGRALLTYEFISLSKSNFSMISMKGAAWSPAGTELEMLPLTDAPVAGDSEASRLVQMREIARKVKAVQTYKGQKIELRLLPQPIDRYRDKALQITDGAVFVFANGTNPEMGMLVETDGKKWTYGIFRMSTAPIAVDIDGKVAPGIPPNAAYGESRPYTATRHGVRLPD